MINLIFSLFIMACLLLTGCGAIIANYPTATTTVTITKATTVTMVVYKDLSYFRDYNELSTWLDGIWDEYKEYREPEYNCVDYSWWLIERARQDGYFIVYHPINPEQYNSSFSKLTIDGGHAITATYIHGKTYLIEPQNLEVYPNGD